MAVVPTNTTCMNCTMNITTTMTMSTDAPAKPSAWKIELASQLAAPVFSRISPSDTPPPAIQNLPGNTLIGIAPINHAEAWQKQQTGAEQADHCRIESRQTLRRPQARYQNEHG